MAYDYEKAKAAAQMMIEAIGHPLDDPNIAETPDRVAKMNEIIYGGYNIDPKDHLKLFPSKNTDMVVERNIPFYSFCSHHQLPFFGQITIAYLPGGQVLGLSKLVKIARCFIKRFQLQEDLTEQIATFIYENVPDCRGAAVSIRAQHSCMILRGVRAYGAETITTKFLGEFTTQDLKNEFFMHLSNKEGY